MLAASSSKASTRAAPPTEPRPTPPTYSWRGDPLLKLVREHLSTTVAATLALSSIWAVLSAAEYNFITAHAILAASDPAIVLAGTFLTWAPALGPVFFVGYAMWLRSERSPDRPLAFSRLVFAVVLVFAIAVTPIIIWVGTALVVGLIRLSSWWRTRAYLRKPTEDNLRALWAERGDRIADVVLVAVLGLAIGQARWLAPEVVRVGPDQFTAYVLSSQGEWTALLRIEPRRVVWSKSELVTFREVCSDRETIWLTALQAAIGPPPLLPGCPKA